MKEYFAVLKKTELFAGLSDNELCSVISCLGAAVKEYEKDEFIYVQGDIISSVGVVVSGAAHIVKEDYWGNNTILAQISEGSPFGEAFACSENIPLNVNVLAMQKTKVFFLDVGRIIKTCQSSCSFHYALIQNLVRVLANKNVMLTSKIEHISQRSTKDKLLSYLSEQAKINNSRIFDIPFNRQQLADYLSVDRSAMSNELCKLRDEGVISFYKNHFVIL